MSWARGLLELMFSVAGVVATIGGTFFGMEKLMTVAFGGLIAWFGAQPHFANSSPLAANSSSVGARFWREITCT
jgi:hypothetical protein